MAADSKTTETTFEKSRAQSLKILALGFGLSFIHLFWYGSPWTAWLAFVCYVPFLVWLQTYSKRPFVAGLTFGYFYALMNSYWLGQFVGKWTQSVFIGALVIFIVGSVWGCFYGFAILADRLIEKKLPIPFLLPILLCLAEVSRMAIPQLEFPFCPFGEPLVAYPSLTIILRTALVTSVFTVFISYMGSMLGIIYMSGPKKMLRETWGVPSVFFGFLAVTMLGSAFVAQSKPEIGVRVALGQLGEDLAYGNPQMEPFVIRRAGEDLIQRAVDEKADLVIFPEAVASFETDPVTYFRLRPEMKVLFGASRGTSPRYQSAYLWDGKGFSYTDKNRLVVFGEYVPFRGIIPYPAGFQLPSGDLAPGKERHILEVKPGVKVGAMICFESLFASSASDFKKLDADFLAIMSLDDWYMGTNAIPRLEIAARWRAVETRKWITRVGSLGKTMIIDPQGRIKADLPTGKRGLLLYNL